MVPVKNEKEKLNESTFEQGGEQDVVVVPTFPSIKMLATGANDGAELHDSPTQKVSSNTVMFVVENVPCVAPQLREHKRGQPPVRPSQGSDDTSLSFTLCRRCPKKAVKNEIHDARSGCQAQC